MNITTLIIDCDGVLNDGKQPHSYEFSNLEKPFKTFHSRDKTAIRRMTESGIRVIIVSADDSPITQAWALSCGAEFIHERIKTLEGYDIDWERAAGIGDDLMDLVFLEKCAYSFCPFDAHPKVIECVSTPLTPLGGNGVISYFEHIF